MADEGVVSAFVDTNIWLQTLPRYLCANLHKVGVCRVWYSDLIMEELQRNLPKLGVSKAEAVERVADIRKKLPRSEVLVRSQARRFKHVLLPDKCDRHVLYAAAVVRADVLVTENLDDFPSDHLKSSRNQFLRLPAHFKAIRLDKFLCDGFERDSSRFLKAVVQTLIPMTQGTIREHLKTLSTGHKCPDISSRLLLCIREIEQAVRQQR